MKFRVPEVVIGCLLTVAAFAVGMVFMPSARAGEPLLSWFTKDASGIFTSVQVVVATVQAALFFYQLRVIKLSLDDAKVASEAATRQARVAEDALAKIERPYGFVFNVSSLKIVRWEDWENGTEGVRLSVTYSVANYGKLPAVIEAMQVSLSVHAEPPAPVNYDHNHPPAISAVLVPGEPRNDLDEGLAWNDVELDDYEGAPPPPPISAACVCSSGASFGIAARSQADTPPERAGDTMSEHAGSSSLTVAASTTVKPEE
ncbi:hypothetical protein [Bradyrhizobium septentrionale]|uniref:Uncharacterized protein n=1 Tax=Bradyrhizobium septentrionale TaxID=1404411 RepID=A0ABZ2PBW9_9BRAD